VRRENDPWKNFRRGKRAIKVCDDNRCSKVETFLNFGRGIVERRGM
jgi:hypothetical protein